VAINEVLAHFVRGNVGKQQVGRSRRNAHGRAYPRPTRGHLSQLP
jgi:hypothetical protein